MAASLAVNSLAPIMGMLPRVVPFISVFIPETGAPAWSWGLELDGVRVDVARGFTETELAS